MKKSFILCAGVCAALVLASCGSSKESAYRKAYEKAQAQEQSTSVIQEETPIVTTVVEQPATETKVVDNYDNVPVRSESVSVVGGGSIKAYSVVVGSFGLKANAEGLQSRLTNAGYSAKIAFNSQANNGNGMYRVVATTFDNKADAVVSRDALRSQYPDAWLLYAK